MKPTSEEFQDYKAKAVEWAQERLADPNTVICDLESTGLLKQDPDTEIAQICLIDTKGRQLFSMLLKPAQPMSDTVIDIHKITNEQVANQPLFAQIAKMISFVLKDKHLISWNADFDVSLLWHMFKKYEIPLPQIAGASCAMDKYSEWSGEWNVKHDAFRWQKLPNLLGEESHDAYNDCRNALRAMQKMVGEFDPTSLTADCIDLNF